MLTAKGEAKVLDFGLARLARAATDSETVSDNITEPNQIMGTLAYMSPEALKGEGADPRSDVYSLGVVLYEMLTGLHPFQDQDPHELYLSILGLPPPALSGLNARVSAGAESIVLQALEKDPARRPQSALDLLMGLRGLVAHSAPSSVR